MSAEKKTNRMYTSPYHDPFIAGKYYHIYNRAHGYERLFHSHDNYAFFLRRYLHFISPYTETYCYCLMPNHYHFLIKVKSIHSLEEKDFLQTERPHTNEDIQKNLNENFRRFQISYSKALNKQLGRKGGLFMHNYCRKEINDQNYMNQLVVYIHHNPVNAGLCNDPANWKYSSFGEILENNSGIIQPKTTIDLFSGYDNFLDMHLLKK